MNKFIKVKSLYLDLKYNYETQKSELSVIDEKSYDSFINIDEIKYIGRDITTDKELYKLDCGESALIISPEDYKRVISHLDIVGDENQETTSSKQKTFPRGKIDKKWNWIARDEDNVLCFFEKKPLKSPGGFWYNGITTQDGDEIRFYTEVQQLMYDDFSCITWDDDEATMIGD